MPEPKKAAAKPEPELADASTATNPVVHHLIARRYTLAQEDASADAQVAELERQRALRKAEHDSITAQLAELGYR